MGVEAECGIGHCVGLDCDELMASLYQRDLAYIHAAAFGSLARGAAPEIVRRLKSAALTVRQVVEVGCGAGALTALLLTAGFEVTAIDASAELLDIARSVAPAAHFVHASVYDARIPDCQAVVALGESLTYHADGTDAENLVSSFFRRVASVLPPGGLLIFDVIELGGPSLAGRFWSSGDDWAVLVQTTEDQSRGILVREIETFRRAGKLYRRGKEVHNVRLFDTRALCDLLASYGFITETEPCYGFQPLPPRRRAFFATRVDGSPGTVK
jgi:SAM-dependent methyltransferase